MSNKKDENNPEIAPAFLIQTDVNWDTNSIGEADDLILNNEELVHFVLLFSISYLNFLILFVLDPRIQERK